MKKTSRDKILFFSLGLLLFFVLDTNDAKAQVCQPDFLCDPQCGPGNGFSDDGGLTCFCNDPTCSAPPPSCQPDFLCDPQCGPGNGFSDDGGLTCFCNDPTCSAPPPSCQLDFLCDPQCGPGNGFSDDGGLTCFCNDPTCSAPPPSCQLDFLCDAQCGLGNGFSDDGGLTCFCNDPTCSPSFCGNSIIEFPEVCDGTDLAGETCTTLGFDGGTPACNLDCLTFDTSACVTFACGNNVLDPEEQCDDGNTFNYDGCSALCLIENHSLLFQQDNFNGLNKIYFQNSTYINAGSLQLRNLITASPLGIPGSNTAAITIDSNNQPHILYVNDGSINYAQWNGTDWDTKGLVSGNFQNTKLNIAVDSNNLPHISYDTNYAHWTGTEWVHETTQASWGTGHTSIPACRSSSIMLAGNDIPHISFVCDNQAGFGCSLGDTCYGSFLGHAARNSYYPWITEMLGNEGSSSITTSQVTRFNQLFDLTTVRATTQAGFSAMDIDSNGLPHFALAESGQQSACTKNKIIYGKCTSFGFGDVCGSWQNQLVEEGAQSACDSTSHTREPDPQGPIALALDSNDDPHVVYTIRGSDLPGFTNLVYSKLVGSTWVEEILDTAAAGYSKDIKLDSNNFPHIVYTVARGTSAPYDYIVKYARWTGFEWEIEDIAHIGYWRQVGLDLDNQDKARFIYPRGNFSSTDLTYSFVDPSLFRNSGSFISTPINTIDLLNWGTFSVDDTIPPGTSISYTLVRASDDAILCPNLDGNNNDVQTCLGSETTVKLQATLSTTDNLSTPTVRSWNLTWLAKDVDLDRTPDSIDNCPTTFNPDQLDTDGQNGGDICDPCSADSTDSCLLDSSTAQIVNITGATINTADTEVILTIPAGLVSDPTTFSITAFNNSLAGTLPAFSIVSDTWEVASKVYQISSTQKTFTQPVQLQISYDPAEIPDPSTFDIWWFNDVTVGWEQQFAVVDTVNHTFTVFLNHFSIYMIAFKGECGNNIIEGAEQCDNNDTTCSNTCTLISTPELAIPEFTSFGTAIALIGGLLGYIYYRKSFQ
jgi:cysteine-rich repeat protein